MDIPGHTEPGRREVESLLKQSHVSSDPAGLALVEECLKTLGVGMICQWDVLVFLHRHRTALLNADNIARLMRYKTGPIVAALDSLEILGLVERSRLSQGARLYQLTRLEGPRGRAFEELLALSESRAGRLQVSERLGDVRSRKTISKAVAASNPRRRVSRGREGDPHTIGKESKKWPKAI